MNLNDNKNNNDEDLNFKQHCLELAKLLRTDQTEDFLHHYDSLPSEWNGSRLDTAKEYIRQLQELDENEFQLLYQQTTNMSNSSIIQKNNDRDNKSPMTTKKTHEEFNTKTPRIQLTTKNNNISSTCDMTSNTYRTHTPVDSFVQLNLKPPNVDISLEAYKKTKVSMSTTPNNSTNNRPTINTNTSKQSKLSTINKSHEDASFDYFTKTDGGDDDNEHNSKQHSRSSSASSACSINNKKSSSINPILSQTNTYGHSKLLTNNDFDSHGSSITTKSSSENSGSTRNGSASDSDDEHHRRQAEKKSFLSTNKSTSIRNYDDTPTIVLNKTSDNRSNQHDRILSLPEQNSYELVKLNTNTDEHPLLGQVPRFKQPVMDDPNGINHSNYDILSYTAQRSQQNNLSSSSHQNPTHEQYNSNHSNSSRKTHTRPNKKRKQLQQQDLIRTESIPGHRGDRDVDELVMFIDGQSSSKHQQQQNSIPLRSTDPNSNTSRRKSRKLTKNHQESVINNHNENKLIQNDEDTQSLSYIDDDDQTTTTTSHSLNNTNDQISLPNDDDDDDIDDQSHLNQPNGEIFLPEWDNKISKQQISDDYDTLSLSSLTLNNSNGDVTSEPFVTVTHRRRSIKERRQENKNFNNQNNRINRVSSSMSHMNNDKRRLQNGNNRLSTENSLSNTKPSIPITSPPSVTTTPQTSTAVVTTETNHLLSTEPSSSSPRLSSHSSSSSVSSLAKRQSTKAPPVVFLNKSLDIELNDVSFGFDIENPSTSSLSDKPSTPPPIPPSVSTESSTEKEENHPSTNDTNFKTSSRRAYPPRNPPRGPLFYSGTDIRPQRTYPSQTPYFDPLVLFQYNQQLAYMNYLRSQYSPYIYIPTNQDEKVTHDQTIQEPLLIYTNIPNSTEPMYYPTMKKSFQQQQQQQQSSQYFYPTQSSYFQPIPSTSSTSSSLLIENQSQSNEYDHDNQINHNYEKSRKTFPQSSSHIMSNALQLVYSQEKRNAQTDRFNLDQLTAYLAMKWTDTVDHYEQGDDEILLIDDQQ